LQGANAFSPAAASPASWACAESGIRTARTAPRTSERMDFLLLAAAAAALKAELACLEQL
jgi:hypothetical protein